MEGKNGNIIGKFTAIYGGLIVTIRKELVEKVIELTNEGFTQKDIEEKTGIPERTQRYWKQKGYPGISSITVKRAKKTKPVECSKVTATDLVKAGFNPDKVHIILSAQDVALQQGNDRLAKFLNNYVEAGRQWDNIPPVWRAVIAGFPIIGQDMGCQSLADLAELVKELHPYLSKELRRTYHKRVQPILIGILAELQAFLQDAATAGGLPLVVTAGPPTDWKDWLPWTWDAEKSYKIDESLLKGNWAYLIPSEVVQLNIDIKRTWAGFLYDIISRLPDPDRQKGKLLRKSDLINLIYIWCSTAPRDFKPALPDIARTPVSSSDHTFAGVYKRMKEHSETSA